MREPEARRNGSDFLPRPVTSHRRPESAGKRRRRGVVVVALGVAIVAALVSAGGLALAERDPDVTITSIGADADTYVVQQYPNATFGSATKLTAADWPNWNTETYLRFTVPVTAGTLVSARVELTFERRNRQPRSATLRALPTTGWSERTTAFRTRPEKGAPVATAEIASGKTVSFDVTGAVRRAGTYAFALVNNERRSVVSVHSREAGSGGPRLVIGTVPGGGAPPTTTPPAKPNPTATEPAPDLPTVAPTPTKTATPTPRRSDVGGATLCGASFNTELGGENYQAALKRIDGYYNGLEMVRVFYPGQPGKWPGKLNTNKRPIVVSFKLKPTDVTAGKYDAYMRDWFAAAPRDQDIFWTYWHEPEDDIRAGRITAAAYRAAWKHLRSLADQARNDRLTATLILMGYSVNPASGRNWRDYYPGRTVIQALGWDVYNPGEEKGVYQDPEIMYKRVIETSKAEELPFGIAETGSYLIKGDSGVKRAAWLRDVANTLSEQGALFVAYFDLKWPSGDFRLRDSASMSAWRDFCS